MLILSVLLLISANFKPILCSLGDQSYTFNRCKAFCVYKFCREKDNKLLERLPSPMLEWKENSILQKLEYQILWKCPNECGYVCMWKTVRAFQMDGFTIPQFFGKWPMVRILGVQEIASSLASLLNLVVTTVMFSRFWRSVPNDSPGYGLWRAQYLCSVFAWTASTVFHVADTEVTEKLDYFSAFLLAVSTLHLTIVRTIAFSRPYLKTLSGVGLVSFYFSHVSYLLFVRFDYAYNMLVFIVFGACTIVLWSVWAVRHRHLPQCKYIFIWVVWLGAFSILEIKDFAPFFWIFDSHSMWHFSTVFSTVPLYKFAQMDSLYLHGVHKKQKR